MNRHKFNFFPEMEANEYEKLKDDLAVNGFDASQPIVVFEGAILDGWNRFKACQELDIPLVERQFIGTQIEAMNFVMRTNKRRNLKSGQWASLAADADDIIQFLTEETENERRQKQAETLKKSLGQKIAPNSKDVTELTYTDEYSQVKPPNNRVAEKITDIFPTNTTYFKDAKKIKQKSPETFEKLKSGEINIPQAKKEVADKQPIKNADAFTNAVHEKSKVIETKIRQLNDELRKLEKLFQKHGQDLKDFIPSLAQKHSLSNALKLRRFSRCICPAGCEKCNGTGYIIN